MPAASAVILEAAASEDGMKLLRFLERRLAERVPAAALHRWIRSGQVRVNGGRAKPFSRLAVGDLVRLPPFAQARALDTAPGVPAGGRPADLPGREDLASSSPFPVPDLSPDLGPDIRIVAQTPHLLVLGKPAGLPCQPGSGHEDSLSARLASAFAGAPFIPAPAHRIDRHTSGLVAVGLSHQAQQRLHALFAKGQARKEYLAWVWGEWTPSGPCLLEDNLIKRSAAGGEGVAALPGGRLRPLPEKTEPAGETVLPGPPAASAAAPGFAVSAALAVRALSANELPCSLHRSAGSRFPACLPLSRGKGRVPAGTPCATLLLLRPLSGRTHQLRVQLASRGFPIIGDGRYGSPPFPRMLLHAFALSLPGNGLAEPASSPKVRPATTAEWLEFSLPPPWSAPFAPDPALLVPARQRLAGAMERFFFGPADV